MPQESGNGHKQRQHRHDKPQLHYACPHTWVGLAAERLSSTSYSLNTTYIFTAWGRSAVTHFYMGWMCWVNSKSDSDDKPNNCLAARKSSQVAVYKNHKIRRATGSTIIWRKKHLYCGISMVIINMKLTVPPAKTYIGSGEIIKSKLDLLINITQSWCNKHQQSQS